MEHALHEQNTETRFRRLRSSSLPVPALSLCSHTALRRQSAPSRPPSLSYLSQSQSVTQSVKLSQSQLTTAREGHHLKTALCHERRDGHRGHYETALHCALQTAGVNHKGALGSTYVDSVNERRRKCISQTSDTNVEVF